MEYSQSFLIYFLGSSLQGKTLRISNCSYVMLPERKYPRKSASQSKSELYKNKVSKNRLKSVKELIKKTSSNSKEADIEELVDLLTKEVKEKKDSSNESVALSDSFISNNSKQKHLKDAAHKLSHRFTGCQFSLPEKVDNEVMQRLMNSLPNWVLRAKALVSIVDEPHSRWLFEKVGAEIIQNPIPIYELPDTPSSLMCIGPKLAPDKIRKLVELEFGVLTPK